MARTSHTPRSLRDASVRRRLPRPHPVVAAAVEAAKQREPVGRPPGEPRTALARWLREQALTAPEFAECLHELAKAERIPRDRVPELKTIAGVIGGHCGPGPVLMLLVRKATNGAVDLENWVAEALSRS